MHDWKKESVYNWNSIAATPKTETMQESHVDMFTEEQGEFMKAVNRRDFVEMLDGLCDMYVVAWGSSYTGAPAAIYQLNTARTCWMHSAFDLYTFDKAFREVMDSNFSKFCKTKEEAEQTVAYYRGYNVESIITENEGHWIVRSEHHQNGDDGKTYPEGKILKSVNYFKPNLNRILSKGE